MPPDVLTSIFSVLQDPLDQVHAVATCTAMYAAATLTMGCHRLVIMPPDYERGTGRYQDVYDTYKRHAEAIRKHAYDVDFERHIRWRVMGRGLEFAEMVTICRSHRKRLTRYETVNFVERLVRDYRSGHDVFFWLWLHREDATRVRKRVWRLPGTSRGRYASVLATLRKPRRMWWWWCKGGVRAASREPRYVETLVLDLALLELQEVLETLV